MRNFKSSVSLLMIFGVIIWVSLLYSCKPNPIDIELKIPEPKLVISSQIIPEQTIFVAVTRSFSALSKSTVNNNVSASFLKTILVENAFVTVSYFDKIDTLHMVSPGIYSSNTTLQYKYGIYNLFVKDNEGGLTVTSTTTLYPRVLFDSIRPVVKRTNIDTSVVIDYSFTDLPDVENWYVVNYYIKQSTLDTANLDIATYFDRGNNKLSEFELLSDKTFDKGRYISKKVLKNISASDVIAVTLSNISEGYFKFLTTYQKSGNIINQISGEPITYPSNINNGYGYFSAHYPDVRIFELDKY